jgi:hypothetical protein
MHSHRSIEFEGEVCVNERRGLSIDLATSTNKPRHSSSTHCSILVARSPVVSSVFPKIDSRERRMRREEVAIDTIPQFRRQVKEGEGVFFGNLLHTFVLLKLECRDCR